MVRVQVFAIKSQLKILAPATLRETTLAKDAFHPTSCVKLNTYNTDTSKTVSHLSSEASNTMQVILFGPESSDPKPRAVWNVSDFKNVDDTVRGGSSKSSMSIADSSAGIDFAGFLDTTTLGGAGFASQAYSKNGKGFPGSPLEKEKFSGLRLILASTKSKKTGADSAGASQPGGGKGPVIKYVLNLKTELPSTRPDGRRESAIVYEASFTAPTFSKECNSSIDIYWDDFKATYRGRPAEAKPLDPSQVKEWSIMARSNFEVSARLNF